MDHIEGSKAIICPWCDCEQKRIIRFQNGDGFTLECEGCNDEFFVESHVEVRFYSSHIVDAEFKEVEESKLEIKDVVDE